jgi:hypothetical protein
MDRSTQVSTNTVGDNLYSPDISLFLHHVFQVSIDNQCSDFELVSPKYFGSNIIWHRPPDQKVNSNTIRSASFAKEVTKDEFSSALLYRLQKSLDDTSLSLLVIWGFNTWYEFSSRVLLIKHSHTITWNEDTLEKLHTMYLALCKDDHMMEDAWLLDDTTILLTTSKRQNIECSIAITLFPGTNNDHTIEPLCPTI